MEGNHLYRIEADLIYPRMNLIARLAVVFGVSIEELIRGMDRQTDRQTDRWICVKNSEFRVGVGRGFEGISYSVKGGGEKLCCIVTVICQ